MSPTPPAQPPQIAGIHHLKLPAHSIATTHDFYVSVMGFAPLPHLTHRRPADGTPYALLAQAPGSSKIIVEIREDPTQANLQKGWDPVTWAVATHKELESWIAWFDGHEVRHSDILKGVLGWVLVAEDPDGRRVRLYTLETHEWSDDVEWDKEWLGEKM